jgi:hypothetical protein
MTLAIYLAILPVSEAGDFPVPSSALRAALRSGHAWRQVADHEPLMAVSQKIENQQLPTKHTHTYI